MKKDEIILIVGLLIPLIPMAIAKQWWLFSVFVIFYICFGVIEFLAVKRTGKSVSQKFWLFSQQNKTMAWVILGLMILMWVALILHLAAKII